MGYGFAQVDAFTNEPFRGNPAAVFLLREPRPAEWMQAVASEMNLPETAFLVKRDNGFNLRWFTPTVEIALAGHPTLASAHWLWESGNAPADTPVRFHTKSGLLIATRVGDWIELDFPATPAQAIPSPNGLAEALRTSIQWCGESEFDYLVEIESEKSLRGIEPDYAALSRFEVRGVIVTARAAGDPYDFVSRFFAPQSGIFEDPVTGSAHCCLGPYWAGKLGKDSLLAYQASRRSGVVKVTVRADRVVLGGQAVTVAKGVLTVS